MHRSGVTPVKLEVEDKLRIVTQILYHQGKINLEGYDPGTGQSRIAVQRLLDRLKKQYVTPDDDATSAASKATATATDSASTPKKAAGGVRKKTGGTTPSSTPKRSGKKAGANSVKTEEVDEMETEPTTFGHGMEAEEGDA